MPTDRPTHPLIDRAHRDAHAAYLRRRPVVIDETVATTVSERDAYLATRRYVPDANLPDYVHCVDCDMPELLSAPDHDRTHHDPSHAAYVRSALAATAALIADNDDRDALADAVYAAAAAALATAANCIAYDFPRDPRIAALRDAYDALH